MRVPRIQLEQYLSNAIMETYSLDDKASTELANSVFNKHNIKQTRILDFCTGREKLSKASEFELYSMLECVDKDNTNQFFTEQELLLYKDYKVEEKLKIIFPIRIKCVKVDECQYIGKISAQFLMNLRSMSLIHYNKNAQRVMHQKIQNKKVSYVISVNESAINKIAESFKQNIFIPNTITLNIPFDEASSYHYDETNSELVIDSIRAFDISDGYHRYLAISRLYDQDNTFDYPMEVRIINFEDSKTRTFIFQEDQKTKMRRIDSASMNMNDKANSIVNELNKDSSFILKGKVTPVGSINSSLLAGYIRALLLPKDDTENMMVYGILRIKIRDEFNDVINRANETYYNRPFTKEEIGIITYGLHLKKSQDEIYDTLCKSTEIKLSNDPFTSSGKAIKKSELKQLDKIYGREAV